LLELLNHQALHQLRLLLRRFPAPCGMALRIRPCADGRRDPAIAPLGAAHLPAEAGVFRWNSSWV
jgi:hypothetical protein